jgi:cyclic beta-1,2-glucan synthetase
MAASELQQRVPAAPRRLCEMLDPARGAPEPAIRSEIFGLQRFASHGHSLAETHRAAPAPRRSAIFFPRLLDNIRTLREAHQYIGVQAATGYDISPAAEWLLDNFHLIEAQLKEVREGLPRRYFRSLPVLVDEPLAGLPRVYGVAWAFVAHTDGAFDEDLWVHFLSAYQETRPLTLGEMWALPTTLRVVLIENLRRLAERVAINKAAREVANLCSDNIEAYPPHLLDPVLTLLERRGVGPVFLAHMAHRLQDRRAAGQDRVHEWLDAHLPDAAAVQAQQIANQAADNLSVSNAVTSLRAIGDADWSDIVARTSVLMRLLLQSPLFAAETGSTRDQTLHAVEGLARRSGRSEQEVAQALLGLMQESEAPEGSAVASHWLEGAGRPDLLHALDLRETVAGHARSILRVLAGPAYLGAILAGTAGLSAWTLAHFAAPPATPGYSAVWALVAAGLLLFPASEAVVAIVNRVISELARPRRLPRLALAEGIPADHRVMVVIPGLLTDPAATRELVHRLHLHWLANQEHEAQFALLTDWADADTASAPSDAGLLDGAVELVRALNARHPVPVGAAPRFIVLHRARQYSESEAAWIGWERKRGKLEQLLAALALGTQGVFLDLGADSAIASATRYVVTLDSDTQLPPGRLRELVGVAAHPQNTPQLDRLHRRVVRGYAILQPRVVTPLPSPRDVTLFHGLFAGQCGIDPYSAASSEVYQDLFGEGTFAGKGLLHVQAVHTVLAGRLPEGQVLSHDLLEGSIARCAAVTDITLVEDAPFHADVAAARLHRWTRGDWQLLPLLFNPWRYGLNPINAWKMFDNLRRSLVAPASLALLVLALAGHGLAPWAALGLVAVAFSAGPLLGAVAAFAPSRDDIGKRYFYGLAAADLLRAIGAAAWHLAQLLQASMRALDAIARSLYRMAISRRGLLQWTTAAAAQQAARRGLPDLLRQHAAEPAGALLLLAGLLLLPTPYPILALLVCTLWAAAPLSTWWVSRPRPPRPQAALPAAEQESLHDMARDTWRLFERVIGPGDHHLPPDNLQTTPHDLLAHRTSPTNIGLYLLSIACARQFGWIGTEDLLARLEATLATLQKLPRHRGHFLNWYDTQTLAPLLPQYVSTVDSGNLSGHLLATARACEALALAPYDDAPARRALLTSKRRLVALSARQPVQDPAQNAALAHVIDGPDGLEVCGGERRAVARLFADTAAAALQDPVAWCLADHAATLESAWRDRQAQPREGSERLAAQRLIALARAFDSLAWEAEFGFLYHRKRHLLHIGYRVAEQQLDAGFYDLLASESRLTSLIAIAKGDLPVRHWAALGRPFCAVGTGAGLRSWSGSMFEYLMPSLVLDEPHGSVLREACCAAVHEQVDFATARGVPWGISESAYAGSDHTLAFQYAPQGVPRLALRRTPADELVIAPYATALAAQVAPRRASRNLAALNKLGAHARYGLIEALDYTPARQSGSTAFMPVSTFMAHHQGMTIVSMANVLLGGVAQRWGMANPPIEAVASLLHERAPREVLPLGAPLSGSPLPSERPRAPGLLRDVVPGASALEPTHLLSNGRYSVALRPNGAGWSRWAGAGITRWRDDALRDAHGSFFYLRWAGQPGEGGPVSITQHPAPDPAAHYYSTFHADRVCFDASWPQVQAHTTVWVSPEDDIEFRQIELRNLGSRELEIELISAFEVALSDPRADESHPAFMNLFVRAEWQGANQALLFERKPRLATERGLQAAHFLADHDEQVVELRIQTDRQRWLGRNHAACQPQALFDALPAPGAPTQLDTGLDPVCAISVRLRLKPHSQARLTFATAASDSAGALTAVIDKYRQTSHVQRASLMSATLAGIRLRALRIGAENFAAVQSITTALVQTLARPDRRRQARAGDSTPELCDRRLLWRFGISGDRPIVLVSAGVMQGLGLLRALAQALRIWAWGGIDCDLVVVNDEPASYQMALQREVGALRDRHAAETGAQEGTRPGTALHLLRAEEVSAAELQALRSLARVWLSADGRPFTHHVQAWTSLHEQAFDDRHGTSNSALALTPTPGPPVAPSAGSFLPESGAFAFDVSRRLRPARPWLNVLSNPGFGAQVSEGGGGYTWALNSRLNQLTGWSNDPVADPPSEWFLLQDLRSREVWSMLPSAWGAPDGEDGPVLHQVRHAPGGSSIRHRRGDLEVTVSWCVDLHAAVKQVRVRLVNRGPRTLRLRVVAVAEWTLGAQRGDRSTVHTALARQRLPGAADRRAAGSGASGGARVLTALLATQREQGAGFGGGTAFLALAGDAEESEDWTCDRRELFDARGQPVLPDHLGRASGAGLDPCAALSSTLEVAEGAVAERVFLIGYAASVDAARQLAATAAVVSPAARQEQVQAHWDTLLGATKVSTPDPLFDALVNRWLLYQAVACRLWAKAGFYQAGGATGFRDQLQDSMALTWAAPAMLRDQIVLCASRQFAEGDVQHWWHAPSGAGVRTHFSDDLLWLPYACAHYLRATGDESVLDEQSPFLEGLVIASGAEDAYDIPRLSADSVSVYEHAARAIDRSLAVGAHGLPLMGSGDWNDGMNRVGHEGRGESVWLGWFLCRVVADFVPWARRRADHERAARWERAAEGWKAALAGPAWDGEWFRRAFFDNGEALGSKANSEARIDLIAQAWSVLSQATTPTRQGLALAAVQAHLVDPQAGLIRLLDPPLVDNVPSAGYIQAYPPGVRENGGQYTHGGVWALMAQAAYNRERPDHPEKDDLPFTYFKYLSPAHRSADAVQGAVYGLEPYAVAGDIYSQPPYAGRGGWSWYTGAAAWLHRAAVESIFGLRMDAETLDFRPCLPSHWSTAELALRRNGRNMRFIFQRGSEHEALAATSSRGARLLQPGETVSWAELPELSCFVMALPA